MSTIHHGRGRVPAPVYIEPIRPLTAADLERLSSKELTNQPALRKPRAIHHKQAQLLAEGYSVTEVANLVGSAPARICVLQRDPTFSELVDYYITQRADIESTRYNKMQNTLFDILEIATDEMQERLEDDEKRALINNAELRKIAEFAADRTVAPPKSAGTQAPPQRV